MFVTNIHSGRDNYAGIAAISAQSTAKRARNDVSYLENEVERLLMISEAMWCFIKENHDLKDEDLFAKVIEIDGKDGKVDGRVSPTVPKNCPECDRVLPKKKPFCFFCGVTVQKDCFER
ncbi:MAG: hypothetical protein HRT89_09090 [Lentisphaeria bacterium]|nr:hypothetical protein [Lentisphaeria bacterium]